MGPASRRRGVRLDRSEYELFSSMEVLLTFRMRRASGAEHWWGVTGAGVESHQVQAVAFKSIERDVFAFKSEDVRVCTSDVSRVFYYLLFSLPCARVPERKLSERQRERESEKERGGECRRLKHEGCTSARFGTRREQRIAEKGRESGR